MRNNGWQLSNNLSSERIARYVLLPELLPRFGELFKSFRHFAFIIAIIFSRAGIFRPNHSFLNPNNVGKFTLGDVLGTAAGSIRYSRQSLPQTAIFLSVIGMISIITVQLILTLIISFSGEAHAASLAAVFTAPNPDEDLALNFLANMFGAYDFMNVPLGVGPGGPADRQVNPLHTGFHSLLAFYNVMMMLMGAFIMGYYAVASFLETALTGVPFGRRFSGYAAPLRAVIAFAILMPLPMPPNQVGVSVSGFNAAQYMVLFSARQGSNFASNLFNIFIAAVVDPDHAQDYVATPQVPDIARFVEGMFAMLLCKHANDRSIQGQERFLERSPAQMAGWWRKTDSTNDGWIAAPINTPGALLNAYRADLAANPGGIGDLEVSLGPVDDKNLCGSLAIPGNKVADDAGPGEDAWRIREAYLEALNWFVNTSGADALASNIVEMTMSSDNSDANFGDPLNLPAADRDRKDDWMRHIRDNILMPVFVSSGAPISAGGPSQWRQRLEAEITARMVYDEGWAGAALFYNDIAEANLVLQHAAKSIPILSSEVKPLQNYENTKKSVLDGMKEGAMSSIKSEMPKIAEEGMSWGSFLKISWGGVKGFFRQGWRKVKQEIVNRFSDAASYEAELGKSVGAGAEWFRGLPTAETGYREPETIWGELGEVALRTIGFGTLADLQNDDPREVNPLATMQQLGATLQKATAITAIVGLILGGVNRFGSASAANFFMTISGFLWTMGTFLANILPIIPFIYFFFGVVQWGFSVIEAVVAAPMFALTHLRFTTGDDRLIPQNAVQGYLMIFEIFLRPMMLIFGLIASITIFNAGAALLHDTFFIAAYELLGQEATSGPIDTLAMIVFYIFLCYTLAMSTFKLITIIPLGIMRWFGLGAAASLDDVMRENERKTDELMNYVVAFGAARAMRRGSLPQGGPVAVKTADGKQLDLVVKPNGLMYARQANGDLARVKELVKGSGEFVMLDATARGGLRAVKMVTDEFAGGWNREAIGARNTRQQIVRDARDAYGGARWLGGRPKWAYNQIRTGGKWVGRTIFSGGGGGKVS